MLVNTIEDALEFLADWHGVAPFARLKRASAPARPSALAVVETAADLLGPELLCLQDRIITDPSPRVDGVCEMIQENQGVWVIGYRPDAPEQALVLGDWLGPLDNHDPDFWTVLPMTTEDALIQTLLVNGWCNLSDRYDRAEEEPDVIPSEVDVLVWQHPHGVAAFWSDWTGTRLYFNLLWSTFLRKRTP